MNHGHTPERNTSPVRKMSGWIREITHKFSEARGKYRDFKKMHRRKNRRILNNRYYDDKIG